MNHSSLLSDKDAGPGRCDGNAPDQADPRSDLRGDLRGDSAGDVGSFESVNDDVRAAVDAFFRQVPELRGVVLWGLCDGASAACFYAPTDARVRGLILLNPWVRTAQGEAQTVAGVSPSVFFAFL